jgi:hypothetical protein
MQGLNNDPRFAHLLPRGMVFVPVIGDGWCLLNAVFLGLLAIEPEIAGLTDKMLTQDLSMHDWHVLFRQFFPDVSDISEADFLHLKHIPFDDLKSELNMLKRSSQIDAFDVCLGAWLANVMNCSLRVINSASGQIEPYYHPSPECRLVSRTIMIIHHDAHYDLLMSASKLDEILRNNRTYMNFVSFLQANSHQMTMNARMWDNAKKGGGGCYQAEQDEELAFQLQCQDLDNSQVENDHQMAMELSRVSHVQEEQDQVRQDHQVAMEFSRRDEQTRQDRDFAMRLERIERQLRLR